MNAAVEVINRFQVAHESVRDLTADVQLLQRNLVNRMELMEHTRQSQLDAARKALDMQSKFFETQHRAMRDIIADERTKFEEHQGNWATEAAKKELLLKESMSRLEALERIIKSDDERLGIPSTSMFALAVEPGRGSLLKSVPRPVLAISELKLEHTLPPAQVSCQDREDVKFGTSTTI